MNDISQNYYVNNKKKLMKEFHDLLITAEKVGQKHFDDEILKIFVEKTLHEFDLILPELPYVGGKESPYTNLMLQSAQTLAFYKACKSLGIDVRQCAEMMYEVGEVHIDSMSQIKKRLAKRMAFSRSFKQNWKKWAIESQKQEHPENWVGEFAEGDGTTFDWGLNFSECGCLKLLRKYDAEEIAPYACLGDFVRMRGLGIGFKRTQTLALGYSGCDFRFVKEYQTPKGWPPESLEEFKGKKADMSRQTAPDISK